MLRMEKMYRRDSIENERMLMECGNKGTYFDKIGADLYVNMFVFVSFRDLMTIFTYDW